MTSTADAESGGGTRLYGLCTGHSGRGQCWGGVRWRVVAAAVTVVVLAATAVAAAARHGSSSMYSSNSTVAASARLTTTTATTTTADRWLLPLPLLPPLSMLPPRHWCATATRSFTTTAHPLTQTAPPPSSGRARARRKRVGKALFFPPSTRPRRSPPSQPPAVTGRPNFFFNIPCPRHRYGPATGQIVRRARVKVIVTNGSLGRPIYLLTRLRRVE